MPAGFTASRLLFVGCTNSSGNWFTNEVIGGGLSWFQLNSQVYITSADFLDNGGATSPTQVSLSGIVPLAANSISGNWSVDNPGLGQGAAAVLGGTAGNGTGGGIGNAMVGIQWLGAFATTSTNFSNVPLITPGKVFYTVSGAGVVVTIAVDTYSF